MDIKWVSVPPKPSIGMPGEGMKQQENLMQIESAALTDGFCPHTVLQKKKEENFKPR